MVALICCVDFGSTFTKAALVDVDKGELLATASHPTTLGTDILDGWEACREQLTRYDRGAGSADVLACSSAGGGLRIAVVGNEELVTAEAGRRVALSSGGRVVHVASGGLAGGSVKALEEHRPDVVLMVGGTDGGNSEVLLGSAAALAARRSSRPVVVAGNAHAQDEVAALLSHAGTPHLVTDNVVPQIGVLCPEPARAAIREMFLRHVIGGKHLSSRADFTGMVRGATPDIVLSAVELLSRGVDEKHPGAGDVVVVDVGGATTDVHSVVELDPADADDHDLAREVVATLPVSRTVEADLGMRASARSTVDVGRESGLVQPADYPALVNAVEHRHGDPGFVPTDPADRQIDAQLAAIAVEVALCRHAGRQQVRFDDDGRVVERGGKDLRDVGALVGSGGVLRQNGEGFASAVLARGCDVGGSRGWLLPRRPRLLVDRDYVLAAAGLLVGEHPQAAWAMLQRLACEDDLS